MTNKVIQSEIAHGLYNRAAELELKKNLGFGAGAGASHFKDAGVEPEQVPVILKMLMCSCS